MDVNILNWISKRKEWIKINGENLPKYLCENDIIELIEIYMDKKIEFFPTQNGLIPKGVDSNIIKYIANFEKYHVKFFKQRLYRMLELKKTNFNLLKANNKYVYFLKFGKKEGLELLKNVKKTYAVSKEKLIQKYGEEEGLKKYNNWILSGLPKFIQKYGEKEGKIKYDEWCNKNSGNFSKERFIQKYGEVEGLKRYDELWKKLKHHFTLSWFTEKYGENEGKKLFNEHMNKLHYGAKLEAFIEKYGEEKGLQLFKKSKDTVSLNAYVCRYGDSEGLKKYNEYLDKLKHIKFPSTSKISINLYFKKLYYFLIDKMNFDKNDIFCGLKNQSREYYLKYFDENKRIHTFFYDFTIKSKKVVIEFNGCNFHPKCDSPEEREKWNNRPICFRKNHSFEEALNHDRQKNELALKNRL